VKNYNALDQLEESIDANGNPTYYTYDDAGRLKTAWDGIQGHNPEDREYDSMSNVQSVTDPLAHTRQAEYNGRDQVTKITDPSTSQGSQIKHSEYDGYGRLSAECYEMSTYSTCDSGQDRIAAYASDAGGRVISKMDALGNVTRMWYDVHDNMTGLLDAAGNSYSFAYDYTNKLQYVSRYVVRDNVTKAMQLGYDAAGNIAWRQDYNGDVTEYTYDAINRLTEIAYPYPNLLGAIFAYYADWENGHWVPYQTATNWTGTVTTQYDTRNRISGITDIWNQTINYISDGNGNKWYRYFGGYWTQYHYNKMKPGHPLFSQIFLALPTRSPLDMLKRCESWHCRAANMSNMGKKDSFTASTGAFAAPFYAVSIQSQAATSLIAKNGSLSGCSCRQVFSPSTSVLLPFWTTISMPSCTRCPILLPVGPIGRLQLDGWLSSRNVTAINPIPRPPLKKTFERLPIILNGSQRCAEDCPALAGSWPGLTNLLPARQTKKTRSKDGSGNRASNARHCSMKPHCAPAWYTSI
jgi:YD repeat-containing protein